MLQKQRKVLPGQTIFCRNPVKQLKGSRGNFIKGITAAGIVNGVVTETFNAFSVVSLVQSRTLRGNDFDLFIAETPLNITEAIRYAKIINAGQPGSLLCWE
ncbi:hypothetical protein ACFF2W_004421 [Enterobacter kobei]